LLIVAIRITVILKSVRKLTCRQFSSSSTEKNIKTEFSSFYVKYSQ